MNVKEIQRLKAMFIGARNTYKRENARYVKTGLKLDYDMSKGAFLVMRDAAYELAAEACK